MDYAELNVVPALPLGRFQAEGGEAVLRRMQGSTILRIGAPAEGDFDGGGLVIDYRPVGSTTNWRLVLGFHEGGMWVEHDGALPMLDSAPK